MSQSMIAHINDLQRISLYNPPFGEVGNGRLVKAGYEEIELITSGQAIFDYDGGRYPVQLGSMLWHGAGERTVYKADSDNPYRCLVICFSVTESSKRLAPRLCNWQNQQAVVHFVEQVQHLFHQQDIDRKLLCQFVASTCALQASASRLAEHNPVIPTILTELLKIIEQEYSQDISIKNIAKRLSISLPYLHNLCKRYLQANPNTLLIERRMRQARWLLTNTTQSTEDIALQCGYMLAASFCRAFRRLHSVAPQVYRSQYTTPNS